jgi:hypothetical protein
MTRTRIAGLLMAVLVTLFAAPRARAELLYGLTQGQQLVTFDSDARIISSNVPITGLGGASLVDIDFRPSTGELYGLSDTNRFFKINTATGVATPVGAALNLIDMVKSFDFDPVNDNIRLLTTLRKNLRVNPNTGSLLASDSLLTFAAGDPNAGTDPQVVQGAYTNSRPGATSATLYNLEAAKDVLTIQSPQNNGVLTTVGPLGIALGTLLSFNGFDISGQTGVGYVVGQTLVGNGLVENTLYTVDLSTGAISLAGAIVGAPNADPLTFGDHGGKGGHEPPLPDPWDCGGIKGAGLLIDVATVPVPEPSTLVLAGLGAVSALIATRRRRART